jgi:cholest-4-en-3-one 26-monooxygenase
VSIPTEELSRVDLVTPELWEERVLHDEFALLRREDPVHWHEELAPNHGFWAITKHEDVVAVSKNPQVFSSGEGLTMLEEVEPESLEKRRSLIDSDAPLHQHLRRVVSPLFTPKAITAHEAFARATAAGLLDTATARSEFDWVLDVAEPLPITVLLNILGVPPEDADRLITLSNQMIAIDDPDYAPDYDSLPPGLVPRVRVRPPDRRGAPRTPHRGSGVAADSLRGRRRPIDAARVLQHVPDPDPGGQRDDAHDADARDEGLHR